MKEIAGRTPKIGDKIIYIHYNRLNKGEIIDITPKGFPKVKRLDVSYETIDLVKDRYYII